MKHLIFIFVFSVITTNSVWSQISKGGKILVNTEQSAFVNRFTIFEDKAFFRLSPDISMKMIRTTKDSKGGDHDRYVQYYKGIKVIGSTAIVHSYLDRTKSITGYIEDRFDSVPSKPTISNITATETSSLMLVDALGKEQNITMTGPIHPKTENLSLCIINERYPASDGKMVLAFEVTQSLNIWNQPIKRTQYINATTGMPIISVNKIILHKSKGKGESNYYGKVSFDHDSLSPTEFFLRDYSRGNGVFIENLKTKEGYKNDNSEWNFSDANDKAAIDVMYGAQKFYDLLKDKFQFNSIDNQGFPLIGKVNNFLYSNAFWDGESTTYGGGDCYTYRSFTTLDVVGHEFAHGFTEFNSGLTYTGESATINEAISDIFGKALEYYTISQKFSWVMGKNIPYSSNSGFRSMSNPHQFEHPRYYKGKYWTQSIFDGPHHNAGVMNYWFYLLVNGANSKDERGNPFKLEGIGMDNALELVFLLNTAYLHSLSDYHDVYENSKLAAAQLFGENSEEYKSVVTAWNAVGLPYTEIENNNFKLSYTFNGSEELNPLDCYEPEKQIEFKFINDSKVTIPKNTAVSIKITGEYNVSGTENEFTIVDTIIVLTDSLSLGQDLTLFANIKIPQSTNYLLYNSKVKMKFANVDYSKSFFTSMLYIEAATDPEKYFSINYVYQDVSNVCDKKSNINRTLAYIKHNLCEIQSFLFEIKYENGFQSKSIYEMKTAVPNRFFNQIYSDIQNPDLSIFDDKSELFVHYYVWIDDEQYLIYTDTLAKNFLQPIVHNEIIEFEGLEDIRNENRLQIQPAIFSSVDLSNSNIKFTNSWVSTIVNDCAKIEDFYENKLTDVFGRMDISSIRGCPMTQDMKEPYLSLDLSLSTLPNVTGFDHFHGLMTLQDEKMIFPPITNTQKNIKTFQIPIKKASNTPIDLKLYLDGSEGILDNIYIFDKSITDVKDLNQLNPFKITNPNTMSINILYKNENSENMQISFYDLSGQMVSETYIFDNHSTIDCSSWPIGMYTYRIKNQNQSWFGKVVVTR